MIHYLRYTYDGHGIPFFSFMGEGTFLLVALASNAEPLTASINIARISFAILLILLANGMMSCDSGSLVYVSSNMIDSRMDHFNPHHSRQELNHCEPLCLCYLLRFGDSVGRTGNGPGIHPLR